jgi:predicted unusual protein kinase regulating ubiquinone biosynthesis (AarF/ABC1/UbiB family)
VVVIILKNIKHRSTFIKKLRYYLVFSGERDGPLVRRIAEALGDDVAVKVARHGLRHDEREDLESISGMSIASRCV